MNSPELLRHDAPALANVPVERQRLVLRGDEDAPEARVEAVAQDEVDDAVRAAEGHGGLGPLLREREQSFADTAGEHNDQDVVLPHRGESRGQDITRSPGNLCRGDPLPGLTSSRPGPYDRLIQMRIMAALQGD